MRPMVAAALLAAYAAVMPVCVVRGRVADGGEVFSVPCAMGAPFTTRYIHSVARTPVEDEYRVLGGALWGWEERISSHGAGLPYSAPDGGSFAVEEGVMIVRGGRTAHREIALRVGDGELGENTFSVPPFGEAEVYRSLPGERVVLSSSTEPLWSARILWPPRMPK